MPAGDESYAWVLHVDLDQFLVAVERLRRPELRGRPVVVGGRGDPAERAVVSTASYEAREHGVHSGQPLRTAARRCPDAVFLPVDGPVYEASSTRVMAALRELDAVVEVVGWDEAFLGVTTADPGHFADLVRRTIRERTGLESSVGIGDNKLRAKLATGLAKPAGVFQLTEDNWYDVMADRPTSALWGIGNKTARRLAALGVHTVGELADADEERLAAEIGPTMGPWYRRLGRGENPSPVVGTPYRARSRSRETTFQRNLTDWADVEQEVDRLARRVAEDVQKENREAGRVAVKVRHAPFFTSTHSVRLESPTQETDKIAAGAARALARFDDHRPVRLIGVRAEFSD